MIEIQGVIFDFNGVLVWDTKIHDKAWREFSAKWRGNPLTDEEMAEHVHGQTNKNVQEYLLGRSVERDESRRLVEEKEELYKSACLLLGREFKLSPGSVELLDRLKTMGIPFTIATSSERGNLDFFFEQLKLATWFDIATVAYDDGSYPGKPAPDIYLKAARSIGVAPASCLVVEDAKSGIESAHAAGVGYIVALGDKNRHYFLSELPGVKQVIENVGELLQKGPLVNLSAQLDSNQRPFA